MFTVVLVIEIILAVALVGVVLIQKSEGGALGMGGGGGGMSGFMTGRSTANLLTRTTAIIALLFFVACISLDWIAAHQHPSRAPLDLPVSTAPQTPAPASAPDSAPPAGQAPAAPVPPAAPATPAAPTAPLAK
jgi:preprotein translocase subunit SecG